MAQTSGFFNSQLDGDGNFDRVYLAEQFADYFSTFIGNGVFPNIGSAFSLLGASGMYVSVSSGRAFVNGFWYENSTSETLAIDIADGLLNRIDNIVIRFDFSLRIARLAVIKGTPASTPVAPSIVRDSVHYDLKLGEVYVAANSSSVPQSTITDTRSNSTVCGWVTGVVQQVDTTTLFEQYKAAYEEWMAQMDEDEEGFTAAMEAYTTQFQQDADSWYYQKRQEFEQWMQTLTEDLNVDGYIKKPLIYSGNLSYATVIRPTDQYSSKVTYFTDNILANIGLDVTKKIDKMDLYFGGLKVPVYTKEQFDVITDVGTLPRSLAVMEQTLSSGRYSIVIYLMKTINVAEEDTVLLRPWKPMTINSEGIVNVVAEFYQFTEGVMA